MRNLRVKIWGSRGSLPSPLYPDAVEERVKKALGDFFSSGHSGPSDIEKFLKNKKPTEIGGYGGNTTCIEVQSSGQRIIIDGGSGIRPLGYDLLKGECGKGKGEVHIFMTHFHWDHVIGLPFFTPIFIPGNTVHFYAVQPELESLIRDVFKKPFFPVDFKTLGAKIQFHKIQPRKTLTLGDMSITPYQLDHPDPCWGYRIESRGKSYAHCVDTECTRFSIEELGPDIELYKNADLMVFDGQYTLMESIEKVDWGHASANMGIDMAFREKIKKVIFMHHDPASSDSKVATIEAQLKKYYASCLKHEQKEKGNPHEFEWNFAYDGLVIEL